MFEITNFQLCDLKKIIILHRLNKQDCRSTTKRCGVVDETVPFLIKGLGQTSHEYENFLVESAFPEWP